ncbi:ABC-2 transporter permease [Adlercreutzia sp. R25]|uniref:ABC-2 transporter permease n=1 Tax=Adlercreutzia shanghongiae TaxID=3111773 RepID=UPI002DB9672F|nr:ABC-2 transporter permease [Adlercreutzia sp. R25]MEC4273128.1 ABC-2 transporter permease [Adlercreutzia sp. R25]
MKTMMLSDLLVARSMLLQMLSICVFVGLVMCYAMDTTVGGIAAVAAMVPFMYLFTIAGMDEQNGWERFRLTLPVSRRQVVLGRYASVLLVVLATTVVAILLGLAVAAVASAIAGGQPDAPLAGLALDANPPAAIAASALAAALVILMGASVALPLIARFGMTKATRFAPLVVVLVLAVGVGLFGESIPALDLVTNLNTWLADGSWGAVAALVAGVVAGALAVYAASAFVAVKLYEQRAF